MKIFICLVLVCAVSGGIIHQEAEEKASGDSLGASGFHHEVQHEHAKSHQSVKLEHFHPVPVYIKKEYSHLLKNPIETGKSSHGLKQIHPKVEHQHGYGLVLEQHNDHHDNHELLGHHGFSEHSDDISQIEHISGGEGGFEGGQGEELHGWGDGSEQYAAYQAEPQGAAEQYQQYSPIDISHLAQEEEY